MRKALIVLIVFINTCSLSLYAQKNTDVGINRQTGLPLDPTLRKGVLENGMTYYIKYNNYPEGYANFQIFHAVGALEEEDNQNGLAHFLEHLAFNGLKHFPGKSMLNYMEGIGIKFGANLNAATAQEYTQYMINNAPTSREGIIDTCLVVLHDWSGFILCDQDEIDAERGVIQSERRSRGGSRLRVADAVAPYVYKDSKYAVRNIIGSAEVVDTFKREELMAFYRKWYYPEMQAIAVVGDFDIDLMEKKIKALFSTIPPSPVNIVKPACTLPDNKKMIYKQFCDKEVTSSSVEILFKHPAVEKGERNKEGRYIQSFLINRVVSMMNNRVYDIIKNGDYPVNSVSYGYVSLTQDRDAFSASAEIKRGGDNIKPAAEFLIKESERLRRYGFTATELEREKADALRNIDKMYNERGKQTNGSFTKQYLNNFINNTPVLETKYKCDLLRDVVNSFTLVKANEIVKQLFTQENIISVLVANSEDSCGIPSEEEMSAYIAGMDKLNVSPFVEKELPSSLLEAEPTPGKIVSSKKIKFGAVEWTLSNGAKVFVLPVDTGKEEVQMSACDWGGRSLTSDEEFISSAFLSTVLQSSGAGRFNSTDLSKMTRGKIVYVTPQFSEFDEIFDCATTVSDYETMLEEVYLYFTEPRFDKDAFERDKAKMKQNLTARKDEPFSYLVDTVTYARGNFHKRASNLILNPDDVDKIDLEVIKNLYRKHFDNPADFLWFFTGPLDTVKAKPIIEKYIGGLPDGHHKEKWADVGKRPPVGTLNIDFKKRMETPKATTFIEYTSLNFEYSQRISTLMRILQGILDIRFNELIREDKGGAYSIDTEGSISLLPVPVTRMIVSFTTDQEQMNELRSIVFSELDRLVKEGVDPSDLQKSKEYILKVQKQNLENTMYWHYVLVNYVRNGYDFYTGWEDILNSITAEEIRQVLEKLVNEKNIVSVTMRPE
jgi:zinc protease